MKKALLIFLSTALLLSTVGCTAGKTGTAGEDEGGNSGNSAAVTDSTGAGTAASTDNSIQDNTGQAEASSAPVTDSYADAVHIALSDSGITVDGEAAGDDEDDAVYVGAEIVYYEAGHGFTYGEGTGADEHSAGEAAEHTVVTITQPGKYLLTGTLSRGQVAVDLGKKADDDPDAVVTLILGGADITCTVAPAVIFYNVYECGSDEEDEATAIVDTTAAGANVIIADGTVNNVNGSYVARIYKSVELNDTGTEVVDSKKLHKYDAAFYSKMSMNIGGGADGTGVLNITAENEGLDSELHLTVNGGNININSGNDGINTNEDGVSVTTINGGRVEITVSGSTGEGDGIDSNGWLVINGGTVISHACSFSMDAGIDSDMGIHINGGTVMAFGNMLDAIADSRATYAVFNFAQRMEGGKTLSLKNAQGETALQWAPVNDYQYAILSCAELTAGDYTLWSGDAQLVHSGATGGMGGRGPMGQRPGQTEMPEDMTPPEGIEMPEGMTPPEGMEMPEMADGTQPQQPQGGMGGGRMPGGTAPSGTASEVFAIKEGGNMFAGITAL